MRGRTARGSGHRKNSTTSETPPLSDKTNLDAEAQGPEFSALVDKVNVSIPAVEQGAYAAITRSKGILLERVKSETVAMRRRGICVKINAVYLEDNEETLS